MAPIKARVIGHALSKKGFVLEDRDHHFYLLQVEDKPTGIKTRVSHGHEEVSDQNVSRMCHQMKLTRRQFEEFIECDLSHAKYVEILRDSGNL
ncbi:MAG: hypothetical protein L3K00_08030 [Thermoplasmata archaeon]|nr:hypothetical protein [Thermoplasmata archaeon]